MNEQTINAIQKALAPVAEKIGQGAQYGWEVVVRQQWISGITSFVTAGFLLIGVGLMAYAMKRLWRPICDNSAEPVLLFMGIAGIMGAVFAVSGLVDGIQHLLNPAYYALDFFIHLGTPTS